LIRKLCSYCKESYEISQEKIPSGLVINSPVIYKAKGCEKCNFIGYKGRSLISEVILVDEELRESIYRRDESTKIFELARKKGALTLLESGIKRVEEGITSLEEILSAATVY
jgi:type II secretory ATPase GspE/PulE/Tfp pilus assembly ATPase PilB-like protein